MPGFKSFREFAAWQLAYQLRRAVIPLCLRIRKDKDFAFLRQVRDAARSGPRNIAEGFGRFKHRDFAKFVRIAKASELELLNHFQEANLSGYLSAKEWDQLDHLARKAIRAANGLIRHLDSTPDPQ
jgi:four helix bundle protein